MATGDYDVSDIDAAMGLSREKTSAELDAMAALQHSKDRWRRIVAYVGMICMVLTFLLAERLYTAHRALYLSLILIGGVGTAFVLTGKMTSRKAKRIALARHFVREPEARD